MGSSVFTRVLKVVNVRNPYALALSHYRWQTRNKQNPLSFSEWIRGFSHSRVNAVIHENWMQDDYFIIRQETLDADLRRLLAMLEIETPHTIPRLKQTTSETAKDYRSEYDSRSRAIVEELFRPWLEDLDYQF
jgi:hypothetical protein